MKIPSVLVPRRIGSHQQVASGRFGVTPHYLMNADVVQDLEAAQGAKPGEGGQLPGDRVTAQMTSCATPYRRDLDISRRHTRHLLHGSLSASSVSTSSKEFNPNCLVSVKLVSEPGVGTIACGVAKAYADFITVSGYDGGTGASPLHLGQIRRFPRELGLAETQQALVANGLRHKVRLQVDGGSRRFSTSSRRPSSAPRASVRHRPIVALGFKYLRIRHLNNCATASPPRMRSCAANTSGLPDW
ncbi:glutamate synthase-related protein [Shigella flexneri]